ncbi:MAG: methyl-accepting chemotaxis protein [Halorhodospira sp.]
MQFLRNFRVGTRLWAVFAVSVLGFLFLGGSSLFPAFGLLLEEREQGAANVAEAAAAVVAHYGSRAEAGELDEEEAKARAVEAVRAMRYNEHQDGSREYVWINDLEPRIVMHPTSPELEGEAVGDFEDPAGNRLFQEAATVAEREGSGFIEYQWPMPGEEEPVAKSSYVELYEPWGWVIGSGVYVERSQAELFGFAKHFAWQITIVVLIVAGFVGAVSRSISRPLNRTVHEVHDLVGNTVDLNHSLSVIGRDEIADVSASINRLTSTCRDALQQAATTRDDLRSSAETLNEATHQANSNIQRQTSEIEQLATAMNEMVSTVQEVARNTSNAADSAREAEQETSSGRHVVEQTVEAIQDLAEELKGTQQAVESLSNESEEIRSIVSAINEITEQTNLLALNAAIEAARAGESGRGFAVVADEVRKLSARTQESTQQIQEIAERFQKGSQEAVQRMSAASEKAGEMVSDSSRAGDSLNAITRAVSTISDLNTQIASAAEEQASTAEEINRNVTNIRDVAGETQQGMGRITEAADRQQQLVQDLHGELTRIRF